MILEALDEAVAAGARLWRACEVIGLSVRTVQRWREEGGGDDRRRGPKSVPHNKLTEAEETELIRVVTSKDYADLSPRQLVPLLATLGVFLAKVLALRMRDRVHRCGCIPTMARR